MLLPFYHLLLPLLSPIRRPQKRQLLKQHQQSVALYAASSHLLFQRLLRGAEKGSWKHWVYSNPLLALLFAELQYPQMLYLANWIWAPFSIKALKPVRGFYRIQFNALFCENNLYEISLAMCKDSIQLTHFIWRLAYLRES